MTFKSNDRCYTLFQRIVFPNDLIFCICVYIILANKYSKGSFYFLCTKNPFSIFRVTKMGFFVKDLPNISCQLEPLYFCKILDHILFTIDQSFHVIWFLYTSSEKDKFPQIQLDRVKFELHVLDSLQFIF